MSGKSNHFIIHLKVRLKTSQFFQSINLLENYLFIISKIIDKNLIEKMY